METKNYNGRGDEQVATVATDKIMNVKKSNVLTVIKYKEKLRP